MLIVNNKQQNFSTTLFSYFPSSIRRYFYQINTDELEEVRIRLRMPISLHFKNDSYYISNQGQLTKNYQDAVRASKHDMDEALELITKSSVYAVENEIKHGYITVQGGHRVGICGRAVITNGEMSFIKDICGLNYRFSHELKGVSDKLIPYIYHDNKVLNTLIISPPQCGKTTLIRDITRRLSEYGIKTCVVDERGEIAGMYNGIASYDLGSCTDVLDFCPKSEGMMMMLRSMSPEVIITDEIGTQKEIATLGKLIYSGVKIITTIHASNRSEILKRPDLSRFYQLFDCFITLSKRNGTGTIEEVYTP